MTEEDNRPVISKAPEWVRPVVNEMCDEINALVAKTWDKAKAAAAAAVERGECNAAEAENDALSILGQVTTAGLIAQASKLAEAKDQSVFLALDVVMRDSRSRVALACVQTLGAMDQSVN